MSTVLKKEYSYDGKPKQWKEGFDKALLESEKVVRAYLQNTSGLNKEKMAKLFDLDLQGKKL